MLTYMSAEPSKRARAAAWRRRAKITIIAAAIFALFVFIVVSPDGFEYMYLAGLAVAILVRIFNNDGLSKFGRTARAAEARLRELQHFWQCEASCEPFNSALEDLRTLTEEYRKLPERRKQKVRELERALYQTQLQRFLERFDIASAEIPHIKDGRKVMLSSYGIDNAADLTVSALEAVPGFGSFLIMQLLTWRQSLEAQFKFDPGRGLDPADVQRVDHDIAKRRAEIEALLSKGPGELTQLRQRILAARIRLTDRLEQAYKDVAQAQADERAAA